MQWKARPLRSEEIGKFSAAWTLDGLDFPVEVLQLIGGKTSEVRCDGFEPLRGIADYAAAQKLAISYAKQRVVQLLRRKLDELTVLAGE